MNSISQQVKVGVFVVAGAALAVFFLLNLNVFQPKHGREVRVLFNYTYGLEAGAPVQLAGVPVGSVEKIHIHKTPDGKTRVEVVARIAESVTIDKDAEIRISSKGLLGQKYLEILPGMSEEPAKGDALVGSDPVVLEDIASTSDRMVRKLENSVDYLNNLIGDDRFRSNIKDNMSDFTLLIQDLREITSSLKVVMGRLERGEGTLGKLMTDESIYNDSKALVADLKANPWKLLKKEKKGFSLF